MAVAVSATHQLARAVRDALGKPVKILRHTRDFNRVDAEEVLAQASLEKFHPKDDYLDMVKQYGCVRCFCSRELAHASRSLGRGACAACEHTGWCSCSASCGPLRLWLHS